MSSELEHVFHPRSIAVAGVSTDNSKWSAGTALLQSLLEFGFEGKLYPLNPKGGDSLGLKSYSSVKDVPGPVDCVISGIPAQYTPQLMEDCALKGVKIVSFFSAGFSEIGEEGSKIEAEITAIGRRGKIRILGPNCYGMYCPKARLSFDAGFPKESGSVAFISQSGGHSCYLTHEAARLGVRFSKVISYGNASDINESELLEYLAQDPDTKIILAYIEGVKDGRRFLDALKKASAAKPVIILKGGATEIGARIAASHTSSLAGEDSIWDGLIKQAGAVRAYNIDELIDLILPFLYLPPPRGGNVGVFGIGGGASVGIADECQRHGIFLPPLTKEIAEKLKQDTSEAGNIFKNPADISQTYRMPEAFSHLLETFASCSSFDLLLVHLGLDLAAYSLEEAKILEPFTKAILSSCQEVNKPVAIVLHSSGTDQSYKAVIREERRCAQAGVPVYRSLGRAANAISKFIQYHQNRHRP